MADYILLAGARRAPHPPLPHQPIALESDKVSADCVVGEVEAPRKLIYRHRAPAQQSNYLPSRGFNVLTLPAAIAHV